MVSMNDKVFSIVSERLRAALEDLGGDGAVQSDTPIFGKQSPLDSTQLVSLIVDIEEGVHETFGVEVTLADRRAMSQKQSPFRDVAALCAYIETLLSESPHGS
jgi:acyl carrier protein